MWKCDKCKIVGNGPDWRLNMYDAPILTSQYTNWPICKCGEVLVPVSSAGTEKCKEIGYKEKGWIA